MHSPSRPVYLRVNLSTAGDAWKSADSRHVPPLVSHLSTTPGGLSLATACHRPTRRVRPFRGPDGGRRSFTVAVLRKYSSGSATRRSPELGWLRGTATGILLEGAREAQAMDYSKIITIEPGKMGGKPCVRGMRITVYDVLDYLASGMTEDEILHDFPDLTREDIRACLAFAADRERRLANIPA